MCLSGLESLFLIPLTSAWKSLFGLPAWGPSGKGILGVWGGWSKEKVQAFPELGPCDQHLPSLPRHTQ